MEFAPLITLLMGIAIGWLKGSMRAEMYASEVLREHRKAADARVRKAYYQGHKDARKELLQ